MECYIAYIYNENRTKPAAASPMMTLRTARHSFIRRPEEPKRTR